MPVSHSKLARLTPNLGILCISVCSFWLCGSIVATPIIYRLVPSPSRYEIRRQLRLWALPWIIKRLDWKLVITWGVSGSLIGWYFGKDGRNIVEICDVKKWRKYSKIIRIRVQFGFIRIVLPLFLLASCNVFFIFCFTAISTRPSHAWIFKVTT